MKNTPRDHFVYRVFDADDCLLYVGCTKNFERRWREQKVDRKEMARAAVRCKLSGPYTYTTARRLEAEAIEAEYPRYNYTLARRRERAERGRVFEARLRELVEAGTHPTVASVVALSELPVGPA